MNMDRERLKNLLNENGNWENYLIAELKWALFCSALDSFKRDFLLDPFPSNFLRKHQTTGEYEKNFDELSRLASNIGCLKNLDVDRLNNEELQLLHWVLIETKNLNIKLVPNEKFSDLKLLTGQQAKVAEPNFIFKIVYNDGAVKEPQKSSSCINANNKNWFYAYHGSRLANFYNIIHNGLKSKLNKTSAFGEGTYLSSELNVSVNWSPYSSPGAAKCALLGSKLGCVALCEIGDDRRVKHGLAGDGKVPERYFIVQDDSAVKVKYLLVYTCASRSHVAQSGPSWLEAFVSEHKFLLMVMAYALLLLVAAFATSGHSLATLYRRWTFSSDQYSFTDDEF